MRDAVKAQNTFHTQNRITNEGRMKLSQTRVRLVAFHRQMDGSTFQD